MTRYRVRGQTAAALVAVLLLASACGGKAVNTIVADTADYGTLLVKGVRATATAVADAEAKGLVQRNDAVKAMQTLQGVTAKADEAATYMRLILDAQGSPQAGEAATSLQKVMDFMDSELFNVLVPIKDETLKSNIVALLVEVSHTIGLINREILGRIK